MSDTNKTTPAPASTADVREQALEEAALIADGIYKASTGRYATGRQLASFKIAKAIRELKSTAAQPVAADEESDLQALDDVLLEFWKKAHDSSIHAALEDNKQPLIDLIHTYASRRPAGATDLIYLHYSRELVSALKRLSFVAQTSGGIAGRDAELIAALGQAEKALSYGAASRAIDDAGATDPQGHTRVSAGCFMAGEMMVDPNAPVAGATDNICADGIHVNVVNKAGEGACLFCDTLTDPVAGATDLQAAIDYTVVQAYADQTRQSYNDLCRMVRAALVSASAMSNRNLALESDSVFWGLLDGFGSSTHNDILPARTKLVEHIEHLIAASAMPSAVSVLATCKCDPDGIYGLAATPAPQGEAKPGEST